MCVICYSPKNSLIDMETLELCYDCNPDGAGFMWYDNGKVKMLKGFMTWGKFKNAVKKLKTTKLDIAFHFRIATSGLTNPKNCHPFPISSSRREIEQLKGSFDKLLMHNGILFSPKKTLLSDTAKYSKFFLSSLKNLKRQALKQALSFQVQNLTQNNRLLIFLEDEKPVMVGDWHKQGGNYFSNLNWQFNQYYIPYTFNYHTDRLSFGGFEILDAVEDKFCPHCLEESLHNVKGSNRLFCSTCYTFINQPANL